MRGQSTYTNSDLDWLMRPCVYRFVKNGKTLYVGSSGNGLMRFADG